MDLGSWFHWLDRARLGSSWSWHQVLRPPWHCSTWFPEGGVSRVILLPQAWDWNTTKLKMLSLFHENSVPLFNRSEALSEDSLMLSRTWYPEDSMVKGVNVRHVMVPLDWTKPVWVKEKVVLKKRYFCTLQKGKPQPKA